MEGLTMDWLGLKAVALLGAGGAIIGVTLYQIAARTVRPHAIGTRFTYALAAILGGFGFLAGTGTLGNWLIGGGCVAIVAGVMQSARARALPKGKELPKQLP
jgi:hypothetical protein